MTDLSSSPRPAALRLSVSSCDDRSFVPPCCSIRIEQTKVNVYIYTPSDTSVVALSSRFLLLFTPATKISAVSSIPHGSQSGYFFLVHFFLTSSICEFEDSTMSRNPPKTGEPRPNRVTSRSKFPQGVYTIHTPTVCDHTLKNRPIHLKRANAYEGKEMAEEAKDADGQVRKYLIPSKEPTVYPKIISKSEYDYFRERATSGLMTKEEREASLLEEEKAKDRLVAESMARKEAIRKMDMKKIRERAPRLDEAEAEARRRTMHLLERAYNLKLEQEEEIQRCNRLILETKCRAIRDAQIAEKKLIERELSEEEKRLNAMMENERRLAIKEEEKKEEKEAVKKRQFARLLKEQIVENEEQRIMEFERKQEEGRLINLNNIAWQEDEIAKMQKKEAESAIIRRELASGNERLRHFKDMEREENRIMDLRIREFQRLKEEREAEIAQAQKLAKLRKEREKERVAAQTRQAHDVQAQIDELNAVRVQEEVEREWRRKEKEEAVKRAEKIKKLEAARKEQIYGRKAMQAMEIERDRREFEKILAVQKEAVTRAEKEREAKQRQALRHRSEILRQVNEKERERVESRRKIFEEGAAIRAEVEMRKKKLREAMERKCEEMRANNVPEVYINEVKGMIENVAR